MTIKPSDIKLGSLAKFKGNANEWTIETKNTTRKDVWANQNNSAKSKRWKMIYITHIDRKPVEVKC